MAYGNLFYFNGNGGLVPCEGIDGGVGQFPVPVLQVSLFSGLFSHASCLKLLRADFQGLEEW